jgi:hypothetical protein
MPSTPLISQYHGNIKCKKEETMLETEQGLLQYSSILVAIMMRVGLLRKQQRDTMND